MFVRKSQWLFLSTVLLMGPIWSASAETVTQALCFTGSTGLIDSSACVFDPPDSAYAAAQTAFRLNLSIDAAEYSSLTTSQFVRATGHFPNGPDGNWEPSFGVSVIDSATLLATDGAVRAGFLQIAFSNTANIGSNGNYGSLATGLRDVRTQSSDISGTLLANCSFNSLNCLPYPAYFARNNTVPVLLGTAFTAYTNGTVDIFADLITGGAAGTLTTDFEFRFVEADGVTPVAVIFAPEPGSLGMVVAALSILVLGLRSGRCAGWAGKQS
jgi:hypothetical protein